MNQSVVNEMFKTISIKEGSAAEDPEGPRTLRMHLQMLDFPARTIQTQSAPANAGTKHLGLDQRAIDRGVIAR